MSLKIYFFISQSWAYNYKAASIGLFGDTRLYTNPDQVETDDKLSWATAFWYWKANVHSNSQVQAGYFGKSTDLINGALECRGSNTNLAKLRFKLYVKVLKAFNINEAPIESGCYN